MPTVSIATRNSFDLFDLGIGCLREGINYPMFHAFEDVVQMPAGAGLSYLVTAVRLRPHWQAGCITASVESKGVQLISQPDKNSKKVF